MPPGWDVWSPDGPNHHHTQPSFPQSRLPKPGKIITGKVPHTITGFPYGYGWNYLWVPPQREEMNRECCNMAPNQPTNANTGPGTGEYMIFGLPTDRPQIGTGGANPCVAVVIKCDDTVYVYHYDAPSKPATSYPELKNQKNCSAFICGGSSADNNDGRSSRCLKQALIKSIEKQGITIDGVSEKSSCGWSNIKGNEGWYAF
jgi:hypothetical protein